MNESMIHVYSLSYAKEMSHLVFCCKVLCLNGQFVSTTETQRCFNAEMGILEDGYLEGNQKIIK